MANAEQLAKLEQGSRDDWNQWRANQSETLDLSGADLHGKELVERNLRDADLKGADLSSAILADADLQHADLRGADLRGASFDGSNLSGASLRETNLQGVDLSVAQRGLQTEQLAGADLTGATLPPELAKLYDSLENVNNISESARKLFLAVLAACLYSWLTIATTTDVNLITNRASSPLPIIQTSIPIVGFYWVAPLLLLCVYFYFHFYLQKLWEELGSLPAIFPDGRPLHTKIDPWLLNDLVRAHLPKLSADRPFLSYLQLWISVLLAWWVVPITMFLFWGRYLPRHDRTGTTFHVALLAISLTAALCLYRLAVVTLRGADRKPFHWRGILTSHRGYQTAALAVSVGMLFGTVSWGAVRGGPLSYWPADPRSWVPRVMALVRYSPLADLHGVEVSQKKSNWSKNDKNQDSVVGAQMEGANLQFALARGAFLAGANLRSADLSGADLQNADLQGADLTGADLRLADLQGANLDGADASRADMRAAYLGGRLAGIRLGGARLGRDNLRGADLSGADLSGADLSGADLTYSDLRESRYLNLQTLKGALHWDKALYDDQMIKALGLPTDHNAKLEEQGAPRRPSPATGVSAVVLERSMPPK